MSESRSLLLIEDSDLVVRSLKRLLRRGSYEVTAVGSCAEARDVCSIYDIGVFDIDLPDGDGVSLAEQLLEKGIVSCAIFYSGSADLDSSRRALARGPLIRKSAGGPALLEVLENVPPFTGTALAPNAIAN